VARICSRHIKHYTLYKGTKYIFSIKCMYMALKKDHLILFYMSYVNIYLITLTEIKFVEIRVNNKKELLATGGRRASYNTYINYPPSSRRLLFLLYQLIFLC
jgi:hypothetical protein